MRDAEVEPKFSELRGRGPPTPLKPPCCLEGTGEDGRGDKLKKAGRADRSHRLASRGGRERRHSRRIRTAASPAVSRWLR